MASLSSLSPQHAPPPSRWPSTSPLSKQYNYTYDCSFGVCSFNCPQWCFLPPPPPLFLNADDDHSSSSSRVSPLMAALIAVLAAAFLLLFYFTVISRFCRNRNRNRRNHNRGGSSSNYPFIDDASSGPLSARVDSLIRDPARPDAGLDDAFIRQITVFKYRREDNLVEGTECAVCLTEFNEGESLRLMPNCEHAFHIPCIDTWLKTHSNCPLCRSTMNPVPPRVHHVPSSGSGQTGTNNSNTNNISSNNNSVSVAELRVERSSNDVVLLIREVDNSVHVVDEVVNANPNLDQRDSKLHVNHNNNQNNDDNR